MDQEEYIETPILHNEQGLPQWTIADYKSYVRQYATDHPYATPETISARSLHVAEVVLPKVFKGKYYRCLVMMAKKTLEDYWKLI